MVTPMRPIIKTLARLLALPAAAVAFTGCIIHEEDPPPPVNPFGDIAFNWSFAGETDCAVAGVDFVDVVIQNDFGEVVLEDDNEPCVGGGLIFTDLQNGLYAVDVTAVDFNGFVAYQGDFDIRVNGDTADAGTVVLDAIGNPPPPPPDEGSVGFFWSFLYPTDNTAETDCALAGVDLVDVTVTPQGTNGESFTQTSECDDQHQGLNIDNLNEGRYTIRLHAVGQYEGNDVDLYDSGDIVVDVLGGQSVDLGDRSLARIDESFSDFDVAWTFADTTCASLGADVVHLTFQRDGFDAPEDALDVDCGAANVVRRTFVPAHYTVTGVAAGDNGTRGATVPVPLAPASVGQVDLVLAP
jgi:hypothetical protein